MTIDDKPVNARVPQKSSGAPDAGAPETLTDPLAKVLAAIDEFARLSKLDTKQTDLLTRLITEAVDERIAELHDIRVGRVLGSALAML
jgi:hypothetical protein